LNEKNQIHILGHDLQEPHV